MMILGVNHAAKDARSCSIRTSPPLNKTDAYNSVRLLEYFPAITVADVNATRFYCNTKCVVPSAIKLLPNDAVQLKTSAAPNNAVRLKFQLLLTMPCG